MKKLIFFVAVNIFSTVLFAQNRNSMAMSGPGKSGIKTEMSYLRKNIMAEQQDKHLRQTYLKAGDKLRAREMTQIIHAEKAAIKTSVGNLKYAGVKHPARRARHQIRRRERYQN